VKSLSLSVAEKNADLVHAERQICIAPFGSFPQGPDLSRYLVVSRPWPGISNPNREVRRSPKQVEDLAFEAESAESDLRAI
jgi:hypothetical protein